MPWTGMDPPLILRFSRQGPARLSGAQMILGLVTLWSSGLLFEERAYERGFLFGVAPALVIGQIL